MAEKTEKATPKKLKDARKKGQIAKAQDMPASLTFVTSIMGTLAAAGYIYDNVTSFVMLMFREAAEAGPDVQTKIPAFLS